MHKLRLWIIPVLVVALSGCGLNVVRPADTTPMPGEDRLPDGPGLFASSPDDSARRDILSCRVVAQIVRPVNAPEGRRPRTLTPTEASKPSGGWTQTHKNTGNLRNGWNGNSFASGNPGSNEARR